jgi:hypothetical protein
LIRARQPFQFATASYRPRICNQQAGRLGRLGHEHVREQLLITSALERYMTLFLHSLFPA